MVLKLKTNKPMLILQGVLICRCSAEIPDLTDPWAASKGRTLGFFSFSCSIVLPLYYPETCSVIKLLLKGSLKSMLYHLKVHNIHHTLQQMGHIGNFLVCCSNCYTAMAKCQEYVEKIMPAKKNFKSPKSLQK